MKNYQLKIKNDAEAVIARTKFVAISKKRFFAVLRMTRLGSILASFLIINLLFGSALTSFRLISKFAAPSRPGINLAAPSVGTQLENGGTESGQIRLIVWKGALEVFKHYPIFGSGVETFAYSYY
ncbi:MAG: O-antigen ligase family protein, partial [Elusimicrobiota bacterium]|nr:O-antigen ligase family protein [Elusimicrobiota bacterium]